jgi:hypothetical protein
MFQRGTTNTSNNQLGQENKSTIKQLGSVSPISGLSNAIKKTGNKNTSIVQQDGDLNQGQLHKWVMKIKLGLVKVLGC